MKRSNIQITKTYETWINELKNRYRTTQVKAALAVNSTLIAFYYNLGKVFYHNYLFIFIKKTKIQFVFWGN